MTRREVEEKFDEIVRFAEIETFIDTPVKRYSSGMYVRLAFAVATFLYTFTFFRVMSQSYDLSDNPRAKDIRFF